MNTEKVKTDLLWILAIGIVLCLILLNRSCNNDTTILINHDKEKAFLTSEIKESELLIEDLLMQMDSLENKATPIEVKIIKGKDVIKVLKEKVIITDTIVIRYTEALETQIKDYDSLVTIQDKQIKTQFLVIAEKDTIIAITNNLVELLELDNENLQKDIKKKNRKIKILKIERVAYPAIVALLAIFSLN